MERSSYHNLTVKLCKRLGNIRQQPMWVSNFAYSDLDHEARKILSLDQLYKSVSYKCISKNCTSVTKAVSIIEIYEGILGENSSKTGSSKLVRQATAEQDKNSHATESTNNSRDDNNLQGILRQIQNCIERLNRQRNSLGRGDQGDRDRNNQPLRYICLSPQHLQRECPHKERNRIDQRP